MDLGGSTVLAGDTQRAQGSSCYLLKPRECQHAKAEGRGREDGRRTLWSRRRVVNAWVAGVRTRRGVCRFVRRGAAIPLLQIVTL